MGDRNSDNFGTGWERDRKLENQMEDDRLGVDVEKLRVTEKAQATELMRTEKRALTEQKDQILREGKNKTVKTEPESGETRKEKYSIRVHFLSVCEKHWEDASAA